MKRKVKEPDDPEVVEGILERFRNRTREEWIERIRWRPEGYADPEGEEDPWKEFLAQENAKNAARAAAEQGPTPTAEPGDEKAA